MFFNIRSMTHVYWILKNGKIFKFAQFTNGLKKKSKKYSGFFESICASFFISRNFRVCFLHLHFFKPIPSPSHMFLHFFNVDSFLFPTIWFLRKYLPDFFLKKIYEITTSKYIESPWLWNCFIFLLRFLRLPISQHPLTRKMMNEDWIWKLSLIICLNLSSNDGTYDMSISFCFMDLIGFSFLSDCETGWFLWKI